MTAAFETALSDFASALEAGLAVRLEPVLRPGEIARPARLLAAMRHAVLAGGKRLRPFLLTEVARLLDPRQTIDTLMPAAAAIECLHCYSLAHDTCRPWTTTRCGAAARPSTSPMTRRRRFSPATAS